jgi:glutathione S-transferase
VGAVADLPRSLPPSAHLQTRPIIALAGRLVLVEVPRFDAGGERRVTAADAYLFTIVGWSAFTKIDLSPFPNLRAFMERVGARPRVREAMQAEGMKAAA